MSQEPTNGQLRRLAYIARWSADRYVGYTDVDCLLDRLGLVSAKGGRWYLTEAGEDVLQENITRLAFYLQDTTHPEFMLSKFIHRIGTLGELAALLTHPLKEVREMAKQRYEYLKGEQFINEYFFHGRSTLPSQPT